MEYGLIGVLLMKNCVYIEWVCEDFYVGNLYFNRGCIGVIVGYQLFGGFNMFGIDLKVGGLDYLIFYMQVKIMFEVF